MSISKLDQYEETYRGYINLMTKAIDEDKQATVVMCRRCLDNLKTLIRRELGL